MIHAYIPFIFININDVLLLYSFIYPVYVTDIFLS